MPTVVPMPTTVSDPTLAQVLDSAPTTRSSGSSWRTSRAAARRFEAVVENDRLSALCDLGANVVPPVDCAVFGLAASRGKPR